MWYSLNILILIMLKLWLAFLLLYCVGIFIEYIEIFITIIYLHLCPVWGQVSPDCCGSWNWDAAFFFCTLLLLAEHLFHPEERNYNDAGGALCTGQLEYIFSRLTGFCGLVMAQVITVETKMNIFRLLKFSISAWRAV